MGGIVRNYINDLKRAEKRLESAKKSYREKVIQAQLNCSHPLDQCREADYYPGNFLGPLPPFRVCIECGYAEDGWSYSFLHPDVSSYRDRIIKISRDEAHKYQKGPVTDYSDHKEVKFGRKTLEEVLNGYYF